MPDTAVDYGDPVADAALRVSGVSKCFTIPEDKVSTLKERALHPIRSRKASRFEALADVSFGVHQGECFGIVGRNGSGKSTLLKCVAGIYRQDAGSIEIRGRTSTFIELGVGFNPELPAYDNVVLNATLLGLTRKQARERYEQIMDFSELWDFESVKLKNYSSGMHVRLAFSVMAQIEADVLVIDEVLAVGDAAFQQKCYEAIQGLRNEGKTILLVTHDMDAVVRFCGRALLLERGRVASRGLPKDVARSYMELNLASEQDATKRGQKPKLDATSSSAAVLERVEIRDAKGVDHGVVNHGEQFEIAVVARFTESVEDPWFVVNVISEDGSLVFGAESTENDPQPGEFTSGSSARFSVRIPCLFTAGRYRVAVSCGRGRSYVHQFDEQEAAVFAVAGGTHNGALVDMPKQTAVSAI